MITALKKTTTILGGENFPLCESPSLRLHKYVNLEKDEKGKELEAIVSCKAEPIQVPTPPRAKTLVAKLGARLLVNMASGILENANCALHRNLGYPVIPGSAVKGVARHAAWCEWNECEDIQEKDALAARIATVFGYPTGEDNLDNALKALNTPESQGKIAFLTAVPEKAKLEVDILTSHHQKYYGGEKTKATDDEEPIPVPFLAIGRDSTFIFTLVPLRTADDAAMQDAIGWMKSAITLHGIGAKTAAGYGWFLDTIEEETAQFNEQRTRKAEEEREKQRVSDLISEIEKGIQQLNPETETPFSVEEVNLYQSLKQKITDLHLPQDQTQRYTDALNRMTKRIVKESVQDRILREFDNLPNDEALLNKKRREIYRFTDQSSEIQDAVVHYLCTTERGKRALTRIKSGIKGFPGEAQQGICTKVKAYTKTNRG